MLFGVCYWTRHNRMLQLCVNNSVMEARYGNGFIINPATTQTQESHLEQATIPLCSQCRSGADFLHSVFHHPMFLSSELHTVSVSARRIRTIAPALNIASTYSRPTALCFKPVCENTSVMTTPLRRRFSAADLISSRTRAPDCQQGMVILHCKLTEALFQWEMFD